MKCIYRYSNNMTILNFHHKEQRNRTAYWDNVKLVMIALMVLGHFINVFTDESRVCQSLYLFIYAFHMPVLVFVAGFFFKEDHILNRVLYYISCGFALKIAFAVMTLMEGNTPSFSLMSDSGIPWFMFVLAAFQLLNYLLRTVNKGFLLIAFLSVACFAGYDHTVGDYLYASRILVFYPFFLMGSIFSKKQISSAVKNNRVLSVAAACVILLWFGLCFKERDALYILRPLFNGRSPFPEEILVYGPFIRILCYLINVLLGSSMLVLIPKKRIPCFTEMGENTLNVYFWHWIIFRFLENIFHITTIYHQSVGGKVIYLMIAVGLCLIVSSLKLFNHPLQEIRKECYSEDA